MNVVINQIAIPTLLHSIGPNEFIPIGVDI
jgi:hypothetical protein